MSTTSTTVRVTMETAERIAALRASDERSTDAVVREALDALYWARMAEAVRKEDPQQRAERDAEAMLWDRAESADLVAER